MKSEVFEIIMIMFFSLSELGVQSAVRYKI